MEVPYVDHHYETIARRHAEEGFVPFMHFGEFDADVPALAAVTQAEFDRAQRTLADRAIALARVPRGAHVLEVGCGFGGNVAVLDATTDAARIVGLDVGPRQLELASRVVRPRSSATIEWVLGDATALPFPDASFDVVLAIECAFHFASRRAFAGEAARVLRPGGRLVVTDIVPCPAPDGGVFPDEVEAMLAVLQADMAPFPDPHGHEGTWDAIADAAGLRGVVREDLTRTVMPSFAYMLPEGLRHPSQHENRNARSAAALSIAFAEGALRMERRSFER